MASSLDSRKRVIKIRTLKNRMQIVLNLSNIDTLPDVFIFPEAALSLVVLILATNLDTEASPVLADAIRRDVGTERGILPVWKPNNLQLNQYDINIGYR